jgi:hypothetical protein
MIRTRLASAVALVILASRLAAYTPPACGSLFSDLGGGNLFCPWAQEAWYEGIVSYCDAAATAYCPDNPVTRAQVAKIIGKALHEHLWGEGRPGAAAYGFFNIDVAAETACQNTSTSPFTYFRLSEMTVPWFAAASACPAGTWVCTEAERGASVCNTLRPDDATCDYLDCSLACFDLPENDHRGWLADATSGFASLNAKYQTESATSPSTGFTCWYLPVWCCSTKPFF